MFDKKSRLSKGERIIAVFKMAIGEKNPKSLKVLDVGCSAGIITNYLGDFFGQVVGIDIDKNAILHSKKFIKRKNVHCYLMDAKKMRFVSSFFDVIVCNQVYECMDNPKILMDELYRVLKPDGIVFFGAPNKYSFWTGQYRLPLVTFLPQSLASLYLRLFKRGSEYAPYYKSYKELEKLSHKFLIEKKTAQIMANPRLYKFTNIIKFENITGLFPLSFWQRMEPFLPNFVWILRKEKNPKEL